MISQRSVNLERVATFCGQRVELSLSQLADLVTDVKSGVLDNLLATSR